MGNSRSRARELHLTHMLKGKRSRANCLRGGHFIAQPSRWLLLVLVFQQAYAGNVLSSHDEHPDGGFTTNAAVVRSTGQRANGVAKLHCEDHYIVDETFGPESNYRLYVAADGHGRDGLGHTISEYVIANFPDLLSQNLITEEPESALKTSCAQMHQMIQANKAAEAEWCGTTFSCALVSDDSIFVCNLGDSKVALVDAETLEILQTTNHDYSGLAHHLTNEQQAQLWAQMDEQDEEADVYFGVTDESIRFYIDDEDRADEPEWENYCGFGDLYFKRTAEKFLGQRVNEPSIAVWLRRDVGENSFLMVGSDGVFTVAEPAAVATQIVDIDLTPETLKTWLTENLLPKITQGWLLYVRNRHALIRAREGPNSKRVDDAVLIVANL